MKIAVVGAGGMGGYIGGRLAQAGRDVTFIARGAHLQAIQQDGLQVHSPAGDFLVQPVSATEKPAEVGPVDLVLLCVKSYDVWAAAEKATTLTIYDANLGIEMTLPQFLDTI